MRQLSLIALTLLAGLVPAASEHARRLALVIGNDSYQNVQPLSNARSDSRAIAAELKAVGFEVTLKQDLNQKQMKAALRDFKAQVQGGDDVVFYFSGHGVQFGGTNYLIPVDITADSEAQVADDAIPLQRCWTISPNRRRDSRSPSSMPPQQPVQVGRPGSAGRGLVPVTPATGQMIMYSAGAGQAALDNLGSTRPRIRTACSPGCSSKRCASPAYRRAACSRTCNPTWSTWRVAWAASRCRPCITSRSANLFPSRRARRRRGRRGRGAIHVPTAAERHESYWQGIKGSSDAADYASYAKSFPKGLHLAEAEMMTRKLTRVDGSAAAGVKPGGPYHGFFTSNLFPGQVFGGTWIVNKDGSVDAGNDFGDHSHGSFNTSDPNNIVGTAINHLGIFGGIQRRYPDGSTSTQVDSQGRLINGVMTGTWHDKFQSGTFQMPLDGGR